MPWEMAFPFVDSTRLFARRGMTGATGNWYCGLHEFEDMSFVLHMLRPSDHFLDIGANIGSYSILAAATGSSVTSIEPIPSTFSHLRANVALNGFGENIRCHNIGLSDIDAVLRFTASMGTVNHVLGDSESGPWVEVPVRRLDTLLKGHKIPVLIKLDVEGHEFPVLRGAERTFSDPRLLSVIMETNGSGSRYGIADAALFEYMARRGFAPFSYDPFSRTLVARGVSKGNTVFVRDREAVERRLNEAKRFRLPNRTI